MTGAGKLWHDRENLAWIDPFQTKAWAYNIDIAEEAAKLGFDEIQFDYTRFPDAGGVSFSEPNTRENRVNAISGFLAQARERLVPYNVFVAADIFGYVCWNLDDTAIGPQLEQLGKSLDYMSPMLYPSVFHLGIPGYRDPVSHSGEIVFQSLKQAKQRTGFPGIHFQATAFRSQQDNYAGILCRGVRIILDDRKMLDAPALGIEMASALYGLYPKQFQLTRTLGMIGSRKVLEAIHDHTVPDRVAAEWRPALENFLIMRAKYLIY